jgi:predicted O-methyltransferase YrrM
MDKTSYTNIAKMWEFAEDRAFAQQGEQVSAIRGAAEESGAAQGSVSQEQLLKLLVRLTSSTSIIAIGTSSVVDAFELVNGLDSQGQLTAVDSSPQGISAIRSLFNKLDDTTQTTLRAVNAPAHVFLPRLNADAYQLIVVSGDAEHYQASFEQAPRLLQSGGVIVFTDVMALEGADANGGVTNPADRSGKAVAMRSLMETVQSDERFDSVLLSVGTGMLIALKH